MKRLLILLFSFATDHDSFAEMRRSPALTSPSKSTLHSQSGVLPLEHPADVIQKAQAKRKMKSPKSVIIAESSAYAGKLGGWQLSPGKLYVFATGITSILHPLLTPSYL